MKLVANENLPQHISITELTKNLGQGIIEENQDEDVLATALSRAYRLNNSYIIRIKKDVKTTKEPASSQMSWVSIAFIRGPSLSWLRKRQTGL